MKTLKLSNSVYDELLDFKRENYSCLTNNAFIQKLIKINKVNTTKPLFYGLESRMPVGKYKGTLIKDIINTDFNYSHWMINNMTSILFKREVTAYYLEQLDFHERMS